MIQTLRLSTTVQCRLSVSAVVMLLITVTSAAVSADEPWLDPVLPCTLRPVHYRLWLHTDFYQADAAVFHGRVDTELDVLSDTRTVIVHYRMINISSTGLTDQSGTLATYRSVT